MERQASKTLIGAFVVGAVALIVTGVLIFGSGQFMKKTRKYVLFFQGSVKGLNVGAAVLFRGVKIGSVKSITLEADTKNMVMYIPVIIEVDEKRIHVIRGERRTKADLPHLLKMGLRAQLTSGSLVTGQLLIELEFHPDTPFKLVGLNREYPEIPTIPSTFDLLFDKLKDLNVDKIVNQLLSAVGSLEKVLGSPDIKKTLHALRLTVQGAQAFVERLNSKIDPMVNSINKTVDQYGSLAANVNGKVAPLASSMQATLKDARKLVRNVDGTVNNLETDLNKTLIKAQAALEQALETLAIAEKTVENKGPLVYEINKTLQEISRMARSIRVLADYLERHPDSLLYGKSRPKRR
ncbi:MAG: MCE family protein [Deltaproteobacteria bacterium]|nr:MCE family protein [Deltaproteobacteria bacterium]MBW2046968.1 MCE family protein [Deltaproteobacteria bacterium]MBW2109873.1 MCE family protein [Deltaproteobacteria bacterium]